MQCCFIKINGQLHYLWRSVEQDGEELDILAQKRRNTAAAAQFFKKLLKGQQATLLAIITDKLRSFTRLRNESIYLVFSIQRSSMKTTGVNCHISRLDSKSDKSEDLKHEARLNDFCFAME